MKLPSCYVDSTFDQVKIKFHLMTSILIIVYLDQR
jgi:hypothetical protein